MRLLNSSTYELHEFNEDSIIPAYAILSHIPKAGDLSFKHFQDPEDFRNLKTKQGFKKIKNCCGRAQQDGIDWVWIDMCCVDKSNSAEPAEAINSAYKWCENSAICYAYLSDVSKSQTLERSKYFTRKWTLQELVAPRSVVFFDKDWICIGTRNSLHSLISDITGIQSAVLKGEKKPKQCHVSERMAWASNRTVTRVEDEAYSIMGLFDITMPILYGEGSHAFRRLQVEISKTHYLKARTGMRLLVTKSEPLKIKSFTANDNPGYAILSHTWGSPNEEVSYLDVSEGKAESKKSYQKVRKSCDLAASHGFDYIWVDTCCIDKRSSAELQEAICSMYNWYQGAQICYVYLEDCLMSSGSLSFWHSNLWQSRWFMRGWTLQELIAPTFVEFYDKEWNEIGTKSSLCNQISDVTGIDRAVLRGSDPLERTVAERMSWAASRSTTRIEDAAYCLMGLFNVFMPMLYGEGSRAFTRLQEEIMKQSEDYTIFAWKAPFISTRNRGLLAHSPDEFLGGSSISSRDYKVEHEPEHPPTLTSRGLLIDLPLLSEQSNSGSDKYMAWVGSRKPVQNGMLSQKTPIVCIWLQSIPSRTQTFVRIFPGKLEFLPESKGRQFTRKRIYVLPFGTAKDGEPHELNTPRSGMIFVHDQQDCRVDTLSMPSMLTNYHSDVKWPSMLTNCNSDVRWDLDFTKLLYSYNEESCIFGGLVLKKSGGEFVVFIGFYNHLPWCSVVPVPKSGGIASFEAAVKRNFNNFSTLSDRSSISLPNGSTITVTLRVGCPTSLNPTVFNLEIR